MTKDRSIKINQTIDLWIYSRYSISFFIKKKVDEIFIHRLAFLTYCVTIATAFLG